MAKKLKKKEKGVEDGKKKRYKLIMLWK